ncbi:hypothetical protein ACOSQ3_004375 [Xanthoceras sorbifolium]
MNVKRDVHNQSYRNILLQPAPCRQSPHLAPFPRHSFLPATGFCQYYCRRSSLGNSQLGQITNGKKDEKFNKRCIVASPRLGKGSSNILTIFTKYGDRTIYKCNYCGKDYSCTTKNGTKSLWNHVNFQCTKYMSAMAAEDNNQKVLTTHASNFSTTFDNDSKPVTSNLVAVGFHNELCR